MRGYIALGDVTVERQTGMRNHHAAFLLIAVMLLPACEKVGKNDWSNIDYARVARENHRRENDGNYVPPPSVLGCTDDDLYNCRTRSGY